MKKKYDGQAMARHSRFVNFLDKMIPEAQQKVANRIDDYIAQNKEYCDRGNYQHLCNIFTCMALYNTLVGCGTKEQEAEGIVFKVMYRYMKTQKEKFQKLAERGWFWPLVKAIVPVGFKRGSGYGWAYTWHRRSAKNELRFECTKCIYKPILSKYGLERFAPKFCHNDIIVYGELPQTDFIRTKTLSRGDDVCDFKFIRYKKEEKFDRTISV